MIKTIIRNFDINSIEDYQFAIKHHANVFITEPDSSLSEDFKDFLKTHVIIPDIVYEEGGYELYLGTCYVSRAYQPSDLQNSKAEMYIDINEDMLDEICNNFASELPILHQQFEQAESENDKLKAYEKIYDKLNILKEMIDDLNK